MTDKPKHPGGRPTAYTPEALETSYAYLENYNTEYDHAIPSLLGLCKVLKRGKSTLYDWANKDHASYVPEFSDIVSLLNEYQEFHLVDGGLKGELDKTITKLILAKHGHTERIHTEHSGHIKDYEELTTEELQRKLAEVRQEKGRAEED